MPVLLQVAVGGACGACLRYLSGVMATRLLGHGFPWGTLFVNVVGSFVMGLLVVLLAHISGQKFAPLLVTGALGGFTTFSAFSLEMVMLIERGQYLFASLYAILSFALGITGLMVGLAVMRMAG